MMVEIAGLWKEWHTASFRNDWSSEYISYG